MRIFMGKAEENKQHKRLSLLNTAFELFTTKGVNKTSISEISEQAGIAKGTFYLYFKDKYDIRNKLISHQSSLVLSKALEALEKENYEDKYSGVEYFQNTFIFIADNIINQFNENKSLLTFISKNLSWAIFKKALTTGAADEPIDFRETFYSYIERSGVKFKEPEIMLFMIIELISSISYSAILYNDPLDIDGLKPYLYNTIKYIIESHVITEETNGGVIENEETQP